MCLQRVRSHTDESSFMKGFFSTPPDTKDVPFKGKVGKRSFDLVGRTKMSARVTGGIKAIEGGSLLLIKFPIIPTEIVDIFLYLFVTLFFGGFTIFSLFSGSFFLTGLLLFTGLLIFWSWKASTYKMLQQIMDITSGEIIKKKQ